MYNFPATKKACSLLLVGVCLALVSCNDDNSSEDFPNGTGIQGKVLQQNEFQQPLYDDRSGIQIILEVGFQSFALIGDDIGVYKLAGAPLGTYTATFSKPGFSTVRVSGWQVSNTSPAFAIVDGFQKFPSVTITELPQTVFSNFALDLEALVVGSNTIYDLVVDATLIPGPPPTGQSKGFRIFFSKTPDASSENYFYQEFGTSTSADITLSYDDSWFDSQDLSAGDVLYVSLYGDANFDQTYEGEDGEIVFPNLSAEIGASASTVLP